MDLINDWSRFQRGSGSATGKQSGKAAAQDAPLPDRLAQALQHFEPAILTLHCYEDVGYTWLQVAFGQTLHPDVALRLGDTLAELLGDDKLYFNSLRPRAVYFVVDLPPGPAPDLPASRYGSPWPELKAAWRPPAARTRRS